MSDLRREASADAYVVLLIRHNKRGNPTVVLALTRRTFETPEAAVKNAPHDPRSEAEKARAALARNAELGLAVPESPLEQEPSTTPQTFGENDTFKDTTENARTDLGPKGDVGDSTGTDATSRDIPVKPDQSRETPPRRGSDEDVLSRAKE
jgi:hypothetical protein